MARRSSLSPGVGQPGGEPATRRSFLAAAASAVPAAPAIRAAARRPNVVLFFPDQMRAQAMGCLGNRDVRTPNIDRLASEGVLFRNTLANTPVCCPARAILQTGLYCHRNGMTANDLRLREDHVTIAEVLRREGYRTAFIGKWHLDGGPRLPGFVPPGPRRQGYEFWAANQCSHRHFDTQYFRDSPQPAPMGKFEAEGWTDLGLEFLDSSRKDGRPFFLTIQYGPPHDPYKAPPEYEALYDPARLNMRPNWKGGEKIPGPKEIASYYAMVTALDDQLGRLVKALDGWNLGGDTIVIVLSDHGDMLGSQGLPLKRKPWEESIRVPGIFRCPGRIRPGRVDGGLISHIDMAPTLLSLCGAPPPDGLPGADLSRRILDGSGPAPDSAFFQIFGPYAPGRVPAGWRGVRTGRYMYARLRERPWVLYDLEEDPYELNNLADDPAARRLREEMERRLESWMRRTGDSWDFNWTFPVEGGGRLYNHRAFYSVDEYLAWLKQHPEAEPDQERK
jgi:arylsulfatase A-like enzyme